MINDELFSQDSELAVLSTILNNPESIYDTLDLKTFMLSSNQNIIIYSNMMELANLNNAPDQALLISYMQANGTLEKAGGKEYIKYIKSLNSNKAHLKEFISIIAKLFKARELISLSSRLPTLIHDTDNIDGLISNVRGQLDNLSFSGNGHSITKLEDYLPTGWETIVNRITGKETPGISCGYKSVNDVTGGYTPGNIWFVAARPSHGKTSFMINSALDLAYNKVPVILFDLEMNKQSLLERFISVITGINLMAIRLGNVNEGQVEKIRIAIKALKEYPIFMDTNFNGDIGYVTSTIRKYYYNHGIKVCFLDYIQLLAERSNEATQELGRISRAFKLMSNDLGITTVVLSQLNRNLEAREDKRPILADLRQSGNMEEDADLVAALYRDELYFPRNEDNKNKVEFIIRKQRNGPIGTLLMEFVPDTTKINEYKYD